MTQPQENGHHMVKIEGPEPQISGSELHASTNAVQSPQLAPATALQVVPQPPVQPSVSLLDDEFKAQMRSYMQESMHELTSVFRQALQAAVPAAAPAPAPVPAPGQAPAAVAVAPDAPSSQPSVPPSASSAPVPSEPEVAPVPVAQTPAHSSESADAPQTNVFSETPSSAPVPVASAGQAEASSVQAPTPEPETTAQIPTQTPAQNAPSTLAHTDDLSMRVGSGSELPERPDISPSIHNGATSTERKPGIPADARKRTDIENLVQVLNANAPTEEWSTSESAKPWLAAWNASFSRLKRFYGNSVQSFPQAGRMHLVDQILQSVKSVGQNRRLSTILGHQLERGGYFNLDAVIQVLTTTVTQLHDHYINQMDNWLEMALNRRIGITENSYMARGAKLASVLEGISLNEWQLIELMSVHAKWKGTDDWRQFLRSFAPFTLGMPEFNHANWLQYIKNQGDRRGGPAGSRSPAHRLSGEVKSESHDDHDEFKRRLEPEDRAPPPKRPRSTAKCTDCGETGHYKGARICSHSSDATRRRPPRRPR